MASDASRTQDPAVERRYRLLARNLPDTLVLMFDHELRLTFVEGGLARRLDESMEGRLLADVVPPASYARLEPQYRAALEGDTRRFRFAAIDGRTFDVVATPVLDDEGVVEGAQAIVQDVTARTAAEELVTVQTEVARALALAPPGEDMTGAVLDTVLATTHAARAEIRLTDEDGGPLRPAASRGDGALADPEATLMLPITAAGRPLGLLSVSFPSLGPDARVLERSLTSVAGQLGSHLARRASTDAIAAERRRFLALAGSAPVGIFETDAQGSCRYVNERWCALSGLPEGAAMGDGWMGAVHPADRDRVAAAWRSTIETGSEFALEYRCLRPDGETVWVEGDVRPVFGADETVVGYVGTAFDISERRSAADALQAAERRLRQTFEFAPIGMSLTTLDGVYVEVNDALCRITGRSREQLIGSSFYELNHPDDVEPNREAVEALLRAELDQWASEKRYLREDGSVVWVSIHATVLFDEAGLPAHLLGQVQDITDRKRAEAELRRHASRDDLTGLANRRVFMRSLSDHLERSRRLGADGAVLLLDLDGFKAVNDTLGHGHGDEVLRHVAAVLGRTLRGSDIIARLGGDEFAVLVDRCGRAAAAQVGAKVCRAVREAFDCAEAPGGGLVTASVGVAPVDDPVPDADGLLRTADEALYLAKAEGGDGVVVSARR